MKIQNVLLMVTVLYFILVSTVNTFAQYYTMWDLPEHTIARHGKGPIKDITYSPDGTRLAVASTIGIWIYDAQTAKPLELLTGHTATVNSVAFNPDGYLSASGNNDNTIRIWQTQTGQPVGTFNAHTEAVHSIAFQPDGKMLVSGSGDGTVLLWNIGTQTQKMQNQ